MVHRTKRYGGGLATSCPLWIAMLAGTSAAAGCAGTDGPDSGGAGLSISALISRDTDVASASYRIKRVPCADEQVEPFEETSVAALGPVQGNDTNPDLGAGSQHRAAETFMLVPVGCYDVEAAPLVQDGSPSRDCQPAGARGVRVREGQTTDVLLISQCKGTATGGLGVNTVFNRPPQLERASFPEARRVNRCATQTVCVTARDPDGDALEFVWSMPDAPSHEEVAVVRTTSQPDGAVEQCVSVRPSAAGRFEPSVTVYDVKPDPASPGTNVRIEDWPAAGARGPSHTSLTVPFFVANVGPEPVVETLRTLAHVGHWGSGAGILYPGGIREQFTHGGACQAGWQRADVQYRKVRGNGNCGFIAWSSDDPKDCAVRSFFIANAFQEIECYVEIYQARTLPPRCP